MQSFTGKVAVVTGGASGIGRALALDFARRGMSLVLADVDADALQGAAREVQAAGAACLAVPTDVADAQAVQRLADAAFARFGKVHVLCNNAGVVIEGTAQQATHAEWEWVLGVNLWGVIHGLHAFLPRMLAHGEPGHVLNAASMAGMVPFPQATVYNTAKYGVVGLTETLARELRQTSLGVSLLLPFWVSTGIFRGGQRRPPGVERAHGEIDMSAIRDDQWRTPGQVSALVLEAIAAGRFYIFTHPETREYMEARIRRIQAAYLP
ncbi:MAG: SDR family NAD(P)-dependent oxidoreductase [Candidatus Lambdaproteobacteria bacterium]|nr:SDR family NAD(P)-dependent oxidoreductase [Candidatus Lambdaproteobacteria bacterium]